jgi:hypothetical protein
VTGVLIYENQETYKIMNNKLAKKCVKLANGLETLSLKKLNELVGELGMNQLPDWQKKPIVKEVALEAFKAQYGKSSMTYLEYAEEFAKDDGKSFGLQARLSR